LRSFEGEGKVFGLLFELLLDGFGFRCSPFALVDSDTVLELDDNLCNKMGLAALFIVSPILFLFLLLLFGIVGWERTWGHGKKETSEANIVNRGNISLLVSLLFDDN